MYVKHWFWLDSTTMDGRHYREHSFRHPLNKNTTQHIKSSMFWYKISAFIRFCSIMTSFSHEFSSMHLLRSISSSKSCSWGHFGRYNWLLILNRVIKIILLKRITQKAHYLWEALLFDSKIRLTYRSLYAWFCRWWSWMTMNRFLDRLPLHI